MPVRYLLFLFGLLFFSNHAFSAEYHIYYIKGGFKTMGRHVHPGIEYWMENLANSGRPVKQWEVHNLDRGLCAFITNNFLDSFEQGQEAKIAIVGYSWGGARAIPLSRCLNRQDIDVKLLIVLDPIIKVFRPSGKIRKNVKEAHNLYSAETGLASIFNMRNLKRRGGEKINNQKVSGKTSHVAFPFVVRHCVLEKLERFVRERSVPKNNCSLKN